METTATILHADLDAFYASVEQLLDPSLRGKAIAVGGGVVLAASYEAKSFGISSGMSGRRARELCPQLIFVGGHFQDYQRLGDAAINVLNDFTPLVERISIDEAFADVAGCTHLFGSPPEIARVVRHRVRAELGLPISIGVARTKHLAKIASQVAKPDGLVVVDPATELDFLHDLPVELMWGVGPVTKARLAETGVLTIGQLARLPRGSLEPLLGDALGQKLAALAWNRDPREIKTPRRARSAGAQSALGKKPAAASAFRPILRTGSALASGPNPGSAGLCRCACGSPISVRSPARSRCPRRSQRRQPWPRSPRISCAASWQITLTSKPSRYWRSRCRILRTTRHCSWNSRSDLQTRSAVPALKRAWHVWWWTALSTGSAIASDGKPLVTPRLRWELPARCLTP